MRSCLEKPFPSRRAIDYPTFFKRGSYVQRRRVVTPFTSEEIEKLPLKHNARKDPSFVIERWVIDTVELPRLSSIENSVDVVIWGKEPKLKSPVI